MSGMFQRGASIVGERILDTAILKGSVSIGDVIKNRSLIIMLFAIISSSISVSGDFDDIPFLPETIDIARESYESKLIRSPYSPFYQAVLHDLFRKRGRDVFDLWGENVSWTAAASPDDTVIVGRFKCPSMLECITLSTGSANYLITFTSVDRRMVDHSLIYVGESHYSKSKRRSVQKKTLYSYFGESEDPVSNEKWNNDLSKTGIFCSSIYDEIDPSLSVTYKRRISESGVIEYKKLDDWRGCRAPW